MISPKYPDNELDRLNAVKNYGLLDTLPESELDDITQLIAHICEVPISLITILDTEKNLLKSRYGLDLHESPRSISFCGHAILSDKDIFIIEDARKSEIFHDNPLVKEFKAIFYAGVPIRDCNGHALGTLCVYDHKPRILNKHQINSLKIISKQVMNLFDLRKNNKKLASATKHLETQNKFLEKFSGQVSHDLKSPLANISSLTDFLKHENEDKLTEESIEYLDLINESATSLRQYIDGVLKHYKDSTAIEDIGEDVSLKSIYNEIKTIQNLKNRNFLLGTDANLKQIKKSALTQILHNLVDNAYKYNNNKNPKVVLDFEETTSYYHFSVSDNGMGIKEEDINKVFDLFSVSNLKDVFGNNASGIGLFTVKSMVNALGGDITLTSQVNLGSTFKFYIKK